VVSGRIEGRRRRWPRLTARATTASGGIGTTTLFAAPEVATGKIVATRSKRCRRVEFLDFMDSVTAAFPNQKLNVILLAAGNRRPRCARAAGCPSGKSPAQLLAQMCDWPARSSQSRRNCRQNGLRQKTNFASRLKRITASSPLSKIFLFRFFRN
jgi:hypothetical protein